MSECVPALRSHALPTLGRGHPIPAVGQTSVRLTARCIPPAHTRIGYTPTEGPRDVRWVADRWARRLNRHARRRDQQRYADAGPGVVANRLAAGRPLRLEYQSRVVGGRAPRKRYGRGAVLGDRRPRPICVRARLDRDGTIRRGKPDSPRHSGGAGSLSVTTVPTSSRSADSISRAPPPSSTSHLTSQRPTPLLWCIGDSL